QCRRSSGSAFTANVRIPRARYRLLAGAEQIREYESSPGAFRAFCGVCGSPVHARLETDPDGIRIRLGGLDRSAPARVSAHLWVSEKPVWYEIADALPRYDRRP
ncbi:MAG TPA: GFA family protein, partial [Caulobacterales bacterium]|nr:GFA family protein [Caulobacterales bacterium]